MLKIISQTQNQLLFIPLILFLSLFFIGLEDRDLWSAGEARAALIAERMIQSQDFIIPTMPEGPSYAKPPLFYWIVALGPKNSEGRLGALAVRIPSMICGIILILLVWTLGESWLGPKIGFYSAFVLATNLKFFWMARVGRIDMLLSFCLFTSLIGFYSFWKTGKIWGILLFGAFCALGTLSKGPVGIFLPILILFVTLIYAERNIFLKTGFIRKHKYPLLLSLFVFLLLTLPWYVLAHYHTQGEFSSQFLFRHNIARFLGGSELLTKLFGIETSNEALRDFDSWQPFWYMVPRFFGDFFPWSIFVPSLVLFLWNLKPEKSAEPTQKEPSTFLPFLSFLGIVSATIFIFFSLSSFKRGDYILPLFPFISLLMGYGWSRLETSKTIVLLQNAIILTLGAFLIVFACASLIPNTLLGLEIWEKILKEPDLQNLQKIRLFFLNYPKSCLVFFATLLGSLISLIYTKKTLQKFFFSLAVVVWLSLFLVTILFFPFFDQLRSLKPFVEKIHQQTTHSKKIIIVGRAYDFNDLHYHLKRPTQHIKFHLDPNNGFQNLHINKAGKLEEHWSLKPPENWEDQQWNIFFHFLTQTQKQFHFLIRKKDLKKIKSGITYHICAENNESSRKPLVLISNFQPKKKH